MLCLSHRLDLLLEHLLQTMQENRRDPFEIQTILVPNRSFRDWLWVEIAKRRNIAMGFEVVEPHELFSSSLRFTELFSLLYEVILQSKDPLITCYLEGKKNRALTLCKKLSFLFQQYGNWDLAFFKAGQTGWQQRLAETLLGKTTNGFAVEKIPSFSHPIFSFAVDLLPPLFWQALLKAPSCFLYLFSPCAQFWTDLSSGWEQKKEHELWDRKNVPVSIQEKLNAFSEEAPRFLSNWGRLGRKTLQFLDAYSLDVEELYPPIVPMNSLQKLQSDLLFFEPTQTLLDDGSLQLLLCGSCRLTEIQAIREEILRSSIPFSEIAILAPDIEPYIPWIEYVFSPDIPYRILGVNRSLKSPFFQGILRLLELWKGRWSKEEFFTLLETPSFYRKQGWDLEQLAEYKEWIEKTGVDWGHDLNHKESVLQETLGCKAKEGAISWEQGFDKLLDQLVFFRSQSISIDRFEPFLEVFLSLQQRKIPLLQTLSSWADCLEKEAKTFLLLDWEDEADLVAEKCFAEQLKDLRQVRSEELFPIEVIIQLLERPCKGNIHGHHLHALRCQSIEEGALFPVRSLFLIGMEEESFPRMEPLSSLSLLKGKKISLADQDRYRFLQAIFAAKEKLCMSYCHRSAEEGKPVYPSMLVQELFSIVESSASKTISPFPLALAPRRFSWPSFTPVVPSTEKKRISLRDLRLLARHPWKFYLQKVAQIYIDEEKEDSFALEKSLLWKQSLLGEKKEIRLPVGPFGEALEIEAKEKTAEYTRLLQEWGVECGSLVFGEEEGMLAPYFLQWSGYQVELVGEIRQVSSQGYISFQDDQIGGSLRVWPDILVSCLALSSDTVFFLRSGKKKQIENPKEALQKFLEYYFAALLAPSPLLSDWADVFFRKSEQEWQKKREIPPLFPDPVYDWVKGHVDQKEQESAYEGWREFLLDRFSSLVALYPRKEK